MSAKMFYLGRLIHEQSAHKWCVLHHGRFKRNLTGSLNVQYLQITSVGVMHSYQSRLELRKTGLSLISISALSFENTSVNASFFSFHIQKLNHKHLYHHFDFFSVLIKFLSIHCILLKFSFIWWVEHENIL